MPKIMTCNPVNMEAWLAQTADYVANEDYNAVMRRCLFVEVKRSLVPDDRRKGYVRTSQMELSDLQAEFLKDQGLEVKACALQPLRRT